ncbi:FliM/FliN family flagellar motor switch protein [Burkholderia oklahomensis]|uniref:FliM/FliN family flagellar motor switch protein n=1 Tax=Burkholderia oklahomensis TaxID=342113 RepID=UPI00264B9402|nr:FliM/FliN family flagellar motor switch protein [Burkholderia oklahomensis]MDN7671087.1 FliM/FliN family flagellar motor switch protein [Burkholderia oklahomensis]
MNKRFRSVSSSPVETGIGREPLCDEIPVLLTFVVGRLRTTLGQLRSMAPGDVLALVANADGQVSIEAHGVVIGYGEFVDDVRSSVKLIRMDFS